MVVYWICFTGSWLRRFDSRWRSSTFDLIALFLGSKYKKKKTFLKKTKKKKLPAVVILTKRKYLNWTKKKVRSKFYYLKNFFVFKKTALFIKIIDTMTSVKDFRYIKETMVKLSPTFLCSLQFKKMHDFCHADRIKISLEIRLVAQ